MYRILVVEDSAVIYKHLTEILKNEGFEVRLAVTRQEALEAIEDPEETFDLALVDLILPDGLGSSIFPVAKDMDVPVIFLTAVDDEITISDLIDKGAEDYIPKPYGPRELISRINKALRKRSKLSTIVTFEDLCADTARGTVTKRGEELYLSRLEYKLLLLFMNSPGKIFTREALFDEIWNITHEYITDNTLTVQIKRLREKIEDDPQEPRYILTVRGRGYRMGN